MLYSQYERESFADQCWQLLKLFKEYYRKNYRNAYFIAELERYIIKENNFLIKPDAKQILFIWNCNDPMILTVINVIPVDGIQMESCFFRGYVDHIWLKTFQENCEFSRDFMKMKFSPRWLSVWMKSIALDEIKSLKRRPGEEDSKYARFWHYGPCLSETCHQSFEMQNAPWFVGVGFIFRKRSCMMINT